MTNSSELTGEHVIVLSNMLQNMVRQLDLVSVMVVEFSYVDNSVVPLMEFPQRNEALMEAAVKLQSYRELMDKLANNMPVITSKPVIAIHPIILKGGLWGAIFCQGRPSQWTAPVLSLYWELASQVSKVLGHKIEIERLSADQEIYVRMTEQIKPTTLIVNFDGVINKVIGKGVDDLFDDSIVGRKLKSLIVVDVEKAKDIFFARLSGPGEITIKGDHETRNCLMFNYPALWFGKNHTAITLIDVSTLWEAKYLKFSKLETRFKTIVENIGDVIICLDSTGTIAYVNKSIEDLTGYKPEEIVNTAFVNLISKDYQSMLVNEYNSMLAGRHGIYDYPIKHKEGHLRWARINCKPIIGEEGNVEIVASISDITELKESEEEKQKMSLALPLIEQIIGQSRKLIWMSDLELNTMYISPNIYDYLGFAVQEAMKMQIGLLMKKGTQALYLDAMEEAVYAARKGNAEWSKNITVYLPSSRGRNPFIRGNLNISLMLTDKREPCGIKCEVGLTSRVVKLRTDKMPG